MDTEVWLLLNLDVEVGHVSGKDESVDTERRVFLIISENCQGSENCFKEVKCYVSL